MIPVVFCVDSFEEAGTELNTVRTAERLDRSRFDLRVVCLSTRGRLIERYHALNIPIEPFEIGSLVKPPPLAQARRLVRYLRSEKVQVFHAHGIYDNVFGVPVARWAGVPAVIASRRWWKTPVREGLGPFNRLSYRLSHGVLANSTGVARILTHEDGVPEDRVHVIPNFVEESAFSPPPDEWIRTQREALGIPPDARLIGAVARLRPEKDHVMMIRAFARIADRHTDVHVVFVGDGPAEEEIRTLIGELNLSDRVWLAGKRDSRPSWHSLFDVSLLGSTSEGFPNSLLEAMALGRALVATDVGGVPDAVEHGANGLLVEPRNPAAFADALSSLLTDEPLRVAMGRRSSERAEAFSERRAIGDLQALYMKMLGAN